MDEMLEFFDNMEKRLGRPIKDLDDVRGNMDGLQEIRECEIRVDMTILPIEEAYTMLNRYYNMLNQYKNIQRI